MTTAAQFSINQTAAIQLTAPTVGAIAVIQLTGPDVLPILARLTPSPKFLQLRPGQFTRTTLTDSTHATLDDALILRTAEHSYELHLHGGRAVTAAVLQALAQAGATIFSPTQAATAGFLGNPLEADLALTLPQATTMTALQLLANQKSSGITHWAQSWRDFLQNQTASTPLWPLQSAAQWLLTRSNLLAHLLTPARIAILGAPNVGKSTLANALLGRPVSITSDQAGTTRDWVDARTIFITPDHAIAAPVILIDTAGIRDTADPIEQQSITRTHQQAQQADVLLLLLDATRPITPEESALLQFHAGKPHIIAINKTDLAPNSPPTAQFRNSIPVSAKSRLGFDSLMSAILSQLDLSHVDPAEPFAFSPRLRTLLESLITATNTSTCKELLRCL